LIRYYLSGSITKTKNFKDIFKSAETQLRSLGAEDIFNPTTVDLNIPYSKETKAQTWKLYMKYDLSILVNADVLVLLPGWWISRGVKLELIVCFFLGIRVVTFKRLVKELKNGDS
jgi:hypothetical protein